MRVLILHILLVACSFARAQSPFVNVRTCLLADNFKTAGQILDSCSFIRYQQDSVLFYKGLLDLKKGNVKGARTICNSLKKSYPRFNEVHYLNAMISFTEEDYGRSIEGFSRILKTNPHHMNAMFNRSIAFGLLEDFSSAIRDLDSCISLNPAYAMAYYSRAYWFERTGKFTEAKRDYEKSIQMDPKNYDAYFGLAYIHHIQKDNVKACEILNNAVSAGSQIAAELKENYCR